MKSFLGSSYLVKYVKWCKIGSEKSLYFRIRKIPICVCLKIGYTPKMDKHGPSNRENYDEPWNLEVPYVQTKPYVKSFLGSSYLVKYVKWCKIGSEKSLYFRIRKIPICVCLKIGYTPKMDRNLVHLIGRIMMNPEIWKYPIFRHSHMWKVFWDHPILLNMLNGAR